MKTCAATLAPYCLCVSGRVCARVSKCSVLPCCNSLCVFAWLKHWSIHVCGHKLSIKQVRLCVYSRVQHHCRAHWCIVSVCNTATSAMAFSASDIFDPATTDGYGAQASAIPDMSTGHNPYGSVRQALTIHPQLLSVHLETTYWAHPAGAPQDLKHSHMDPQRSLYLPRSHESLGKYQASRPSR